MVVKMASMKAVRTADQTVDSLAEMSVAWMAAKRVDLMAGT
jgi:hypothetical protein